MRLAPIAAALTALAVGLAACGEKEEPEPAAPTVTAKPVEKGGGGGGDAKGGDGGGQKASPAQEIETTVADVLGGGDPASACRDLVTARYVRTAYGNEQGCRAAVADQPRFEVGVSDVEISGAGATARAEPRGGPNRGETIKVELVEEGATWKVDSALSNAPPGP